MCFGAAPMPASQSRTCRRCAKVWRCADDKSRRFSIAPSGIEAEQDSGPVPALRTILPPCQPGLSGSSSEIQAERRQRKTTAILLQYKRKWARRGDLLLDSCGRAEKALPVRSAAGSAGNASGGTTFLMEPWRNGAFPLPSKTRCPIIYTPRAGAITLRARYEAYS